MMIGRTADLHNQGLDKTAVLLRRSACFARLRVCALLRALAEVLGWRKPKLRSKCGYCVRGGTSRSAFVITLGLVLAMCGQFARAQSLSEPEVDFEHALVAARTLCSSNRQLLSTDLCKAVKDADLQLAKEIDGAGSEKAQYLVVTTLNRYLASGANDLTTKLRNLGQKLASGDLKDLPDLAVVPQSFCTDLGIKAGFCRLPACFFRSHKGDDVNQECPAEPLPLDEQSLKTASAKWINAHLAEFAPCPADQQPCIPIDRFAVAARSIFASQGASIVNGMAAAVNSGRQMLDSAAIDQLTRSELTCIADRSLALQLATSISSENLDAALAPFRANGTKPEEILASIKISRSRPCTDDATKDLFARVATLLVTTHKNSLAPPPIVNASESAALTHSTPPSLTDLIFDLPLQNSGLISGLRLRLDRRPIDDKMTVTGRLSLLLQEADRPTAGHQNPTLPCCKDTREIDLNIRLANVRVTENHPLLESPLGVNNYSVDESKLAYAVQEVAGVPSLIVRVSKIALSRNFLPLTFDTKLTLPGLPVTVDAGTMIFAADGLSDSVRQLVDRDALVTKLNQELLKLGPVPLKAPLVGEFSADKITVHLGDRGPNQFAYDVHFRSALMDSLTDGEGVPAILSVDRDGHATVEATIPSSKALSRLTDEVTKAVNSLLPANLKAQLLASDAWVRIENPVLRNGAISFAIVFAPPGMQPLDPLSITLKPGESAPQQISDQLTDQANRLNALFNSYAQNVLKRQGEKWLSSQLRFSEAALRASLSEGISLFGMQLQVTDIKSENGHLSVTARSSGNGTPTFEVAGIRIGELDASGHPVLSLDHAKIEGDFTSWIDSSLGSSEYVQLRITNAYFSGEGGLMLSGTVLIPALGDPFSIEIGPVTTSESPLKAGNIKQLLLGRALSEANNRCKGCHIDVGPLSVSVAEFKPGSGDQLMLDGTFTFRDLIQGTAEVIIYPQLKITDNVKLNPASQAVFESLLHLPIGGIHPSIETFNPLAIKVVVDLSSFGFPFKFPGGFDLPPLAVRIPSSGDIQIAEPFSFPIPGDFPIVPPIILSYARLDLYPRSLWKFGLSGDITAAQGMLANVAKIAARFEGNLQSLDFQFTGPLYLANSLQLMETTGHLNIPNILAEATSRTSGIAKQIVMSDGQLILNGKTCSFQDHMSLQFLFVSLNGILGIQLRGCGSEGGVCPVRSGALGAVCAKGNVNLGPLGSAEGSADFALDLSLPTVEARVDNVSPFGVSVSVRASDSFAKASFGALGFEFSLITPSVKTITPDLIAKMIEEALQLNISLDALLNRKITVSLLPSSNGSEGDPQASAGPTDGGGDVEGGTGPSTSLPGRPQPGFENFTAASEGSKTSPARGSGASQQNPWSPGPYTVSFKPLEGNPNLYLRQYAKNDIVVETDPWLLHASKKKILEDLTYSPYPDLVTSANTTAIDRNGFRRHREYQLFSAPPGGGYSCSSGVCVMRLGPEDDGNETLRDIAGVDHLRLVFGSDEPVNAGFRKLTPFARPAQFGVLADLAQASWEPEVFGKLTGVTCLTPENPCTRFAVGTTTAQGPVTIIHSDKSAWPNSRFDHPLRVFGNSLLAAALGKSDQSPWVLGVVDGTTHVAVLQADSDSFLVSSWVTDHNVSRPAISVYTPGQGLGHPALLKGLWLAGFGPGANLPSSANSLYRNLHTLIKSRQSGPDALPAQISGLTKQRVSLVYREKGTTAAIFAVITGDSKTACLRQASAETIVNKWKQWNANGEAPALGNDYDADFERLENLILSSKQTWRQEGFQRNPLLLLTTQNTSDSICTN